MKDTLNAIKSFDKALQIKSDYLPALKSKSDLYVKQKNFTKAMIELDKILIYEPNNAISYIQKADILCKNNNLKEGVENYKIAYGLKPDHPFLIGDMIHAKNKICDWSNNDIELKKLEQSILNKKKSAPPFAATTLFDSPKLLFDTAKSLARDISNPRIGRNYTKYLRTNKKKIKLGFYSADFRTHAMGTFNGSNARVP